MGFQYCGFNVESDSQCDGTLSVSRPQDQDRLIKFKELSFTHSVDCKDDRTTSENQGLYGINKCESEKFNVCIGWSHLLVGTGKEIIVLKKKGQSSIFSVVNEKEITSLSTGWDKTLAINCTGECLVWKDHCFDNTPFRLQNVNGIDTDTNFKKFLQVDCGEQHTVLVSESGEVGEIVEDKANWSVFLYQKLDLNLKIQSVVCGKEHVLLKSRIGVVFSYGLGSRGQLGHGSTENLLQPKIIEALHGVSMVTIAAGGWHSAAISDIGDLYLWGWNESGQIGLPCKATVSNNTDKSSAATTQDTVNIQLIPKLVDPWPNGDDVTVTEVACGSRHIAAVSDNGVLYTWGWNDYGQLGHGDTVTRDKPTEVVMENISVTKVYCGYWNTVIHVEDR